MRSACFQTGCSSDARYLYCLGGTILVLCEAHGDAYELALGERSVSVYGLASGDIKIVGATGPDRTVLALRNLRFALERLGERDPEFTSRLREFVGGLGAEPSVQDMERLGCVELVTALVRGLVRSDAGTFSVTLAISDAVAAALRPYPGLSRVWEEVAVREGARQQR